jgi:signal transduction histidine kinase
LSSRSPLQAVSPPRLFVLADDPRTAERARAAAGGLFAVETASAALDCAPPCALLCDPRRGGLRALLALRSAGAGEWVPVLLLASRVTAEERGLWLSAGADDVLDGALEPVELAGRVRLALDRAAAFQQRLRQQRDELAMELHDGVSASLVRAALLLDPSRARPAEALQSVRDGLEELRTLLSGLAGGSQAPSWEELIAEVRLELQKGCEGGGLQLRFEARSDGTCARPGFAAAHALRRIAREALTNVLRHARAKQVTCLVEARRGRLHLRLEDDGPGPALPGAPGRGLSNMAARARRLGGAAHFARRADGLGGQLEAELAK